MKRDPALVYCPNCSRPVVIQPGDNASCCGIEWQGCASRYLSRRPITETEREESFQRAWANIAIAPDGASSLPGESS